MSADELSARLDRQDRVLDEIHTALVGNTELGHPGLVRRMDSVEKKLTSQEHQMLKWAGVVTGLSIALGALKQKLFG